MSALQGNYQNETAAIMQIAQRFMTRTVSTGVAVTMTVAQFVNGIWHQDTADAGTKTSPTATAIVAGIEGCKVGTTFWFVVHNAGGATVTIAGGTGVTAVGTLTVADAKNRVFLGVVTGVDTPAVHLYGLAALA